MANTQFYQPVIQNGVLVIGEERAGAALPFGTTSGPLVSNQSGQERTGLSELAILIVAWAENRNNSFSARECFSSLRRKAQKMAYLNVAIVELETAGILYSYDQPARSGRGRNAPRRYELVPNSVYSDDGVHTNTVNCAYGDGQRVIMCIQYSYDGNGLEWLPDVQDVAGEDFEAWCDAFDLKDLATIHRFRIAKQHGDFTRGYNLEVQFPATPHPDLRDYAGSLLDDAAEYLIRHWPMAAAA